MLSDESLSLEERGQAVLAAGEVKIRSMRARGPLDDLVARIELEPGDHLPAGTELVRYYRMKYSTITRWRHRSDASAFAFYTELFRGGAATGPCPAWPPEAAVKTNNSSAPSMAKYGRRMSALHDSLAGGD